MRTFKRKARSLHTKAKRRLRYWLWSLAPRSTVRAAHPLPGPLVLSVTSYPPRFPTLAPVLRSLLNQTVQPDITILWVSESDFHKLPKEVLGLRSSGLQIETCPDFRSYKKLIPALLKYPDAFIVTADDDIVYERRWLEPLVSEYRSKDEILCLRAHTVTLNDNGTTKPYREWKWEEASEFSTPFTFPTCGAGALFPPGIFDPRVCDHDTFMSLAPTADDVWFFWMASLNGALFRKVGPANPLLILVPRSQKVSLAQTNNGASDQNSAQIRNLEMRFGTPKTWSNDRIESDIDPSGRIEITS